MVAPAREARVRPDYPGIATMTGSRLGVLAVIDGYRLTGPARQLLASADRFPNTRVTLAVFQRSATPTPFMAAVRRAGVPMVAVGDRFPGDSRTALALARLAARPEIDILQTHGYKANVLARLVARRVRRPWVAFLHGDTRENWKVRVYFALERRAVSHADRVIVVSHAMARQMAARGIPTSRIRVVHNACLVEPHLDGEVAAWRPGAPPVIGVIGRLSPEKGIDVALRVQALVVRHCREARLWVVGEGGERARLEKMAGGLGIAGAVEWLGYQDDPASLYREMAVLLMPSRSEGLPNVALEAMAYGLPVVATAVGGVPEVIADGRTGFLAPAEDVEGLADRVVRLLEDASLRRRLGRQGQEEVRDRFSLGARVRALARIYEEVIADQRGGLPTASTAGIAEPGPEAA